MTLSELSSDWTVLVMVQVLNVIVVAEVSGKDLQKVIQKRLLKILSS